MESPMDYIITIMTIAKVIIGHKLIDSLSLNGSRPLVSTFYSNSIYGSNHLFHFDLNQEFILEPF